jgi:hypothetical protein
MKFLPSKASKWIGFGFAFFSRSDKNDPRKHTKRPEQNSFGFGYFMDRFTWGSSKLTESDTTAKRYSLRPDHRWAYNALISTDCLAYAASPLFKRFSLKVKPALGCFSLEARRRLV